MLERSDFEGSDSAEDCATGSWGIRVMQSDVVVLSMNCLLELKCGLGIKGLGISRLGFWIALEGLGKKENRTAMKEKWEPLSWPLIMAEDKAFG